MIPVRRPEQTFEDHQAEVASWLGTDVATMNQDHDSFHAAMACWLRIPSHALRNAAGEQLSHQERLLAILEETAVLCAARWIYHAGAEVPG